MDYLSEFLLKFKNCSTVEFTYVRMRMGGEGWPVNKGASTSLIYEGSYCRTHYRRTVAEPTLLALVPKPAVVPVSPPIVGKNTNPLYLFIYWCTVRYKMHVTVLGRRNLLRTVDEDSSDMLNVGWCTVRYKMHVALLGRHNLFCKTKTVMGHCT